MALELSDRQKALVIYVQKLSQDQRHRLTIICRGNEPWEIEKEVTQEKIELKSMQSDKLR